MPKNSSKRFFNFEEEKMAEKTKLRKALDKLVDTKVGSKDSPKTFEGLKVLHSKDHKMNQEKKGSSVEKDQEFSSKQEVNPKAEKKLSAKKQKANLKSVKFSEPKENKGLTSIKKSLSKEKTPNSVNKGKAESHNWSEDVLKVVEARKLQMVSKTGINQGVTSPLQMHLIRSESLRIAQDKIADLEEELHRFRQKNESLISASEVLKDKNDLLQSKLADLKYLSKEEKDNFKGEKEILLSALEEAKTQINKLKGKKQELEKRLSRDLHGIHARENSLESRIEILKMENSVLQREKDRKIIELQKQIQKIKANLEEAHKKNQDLQMLNNKLQESSRRTVSSLRATIYNLEGVRSKNEETLVTEITEE